MNFAEWCKNQTGHYCNGVTDPASCCPVAHGAYKDYCTCKVSPEMAEAVRKFQHEQYLETWRQYDKKLHKFVLRNHRFDSANYVSCRKHSGAGPLKEGKCSFCGESVDWEVML